MCTRATMCQGITGIQCTACGAPTQKNSILNNSTGAHSYKEREEEDEREKETIDATESRHFRVAGSGQTAESGPLPALLTRENKQA